MTPDELAHRLRTQGEPVFTGLGATVFLLDGMRFAVETTYPGDADHAFAPSRIESLPWHYGEDHFTAIQAKRKIA
jgi:hypothetical protein